jgi:hypothetical protein
MKIAPVTRRAHFSNWTSVLNALLSKHRLCDRWSLVPAGLVSGRDLSCEVAQENCGKGLLISLSGLDCGGGRSAVPVRRRWLLACDY